MNQDDQGSQIMESELMGDDRSPSVLQTFLAAVLFLTRVPIPFGRDRSAEFHREALTRGVVFFPVVGGLLGLWTAIVLIGCLALGVPPLVAALVALGIEAALTGAFHEDAFADTWDALGGGWDREQVLRIMKDSRLGTYGTIGLVIGVGIRAATMAELSKYDSIYASCAIVAAATMGRIAIVVMMATTPPIQDRQSHAKDVSGSQTVMSLVYASLLSGLFWMGWCFLAPVAALISLIIAFALGAWFRRKVMRRLGGTTGDLLGCTAYLVQLIVLIVASSDWSFQT